MTFDLVGSPLAAGSSRPRVCSPRRCRSSRCRSSSTSASRANGTARPFDHYADRDYPGTTLGFHAFDPARRPVSTAPAEAEVFTTTSPSPRSSGTDPRTVYRQLARRTTLQRTLRGRHAAPVDVHRCCPSGCSGLTDRSALARLAAAAARSSSRSASTRCSCRTTRSSSRRRSSCGCCSARTCIENDLAARCGRCATFLTLAIVDPLALAKRPSSTGSRSTSSSTPPGLRACSETLATLPRKPAVVLFRFDPKNTGRRGARLQHGNRLARRRHRHPRPRSGRSATSRSSATTPAHSRIAAFYLYDRGRRFDHVSRHGRELATQEASATTEAYRAAQRSDMRSFDSSSASLRVRREFLHRSIISKLPKETRHGRPQRPHRAVPEDGRRGPAERAGALFARPGAARRRATSPTPRRRFQRAIALDPNIGKLYQLLAEAQLQTGHRDYAIQTLPDRRAASRTAAATCCPERDDRDAQGAGRRSPSSTLRRPTCPSAKAKSCAAAAAASTASSPPRRSATRRAS